MKSIRTQQSSRGVSLVEAMVALAVMAFGMLAVVGVQSTLRLNADIAKQRSEATRLAQETLENYRAFATIDAAGCPQSAWNCIADRTTTVNGANAVYEVRRDVITNSYPDPPAKAVRVTVSWADRAADTSGDPNLKNQSVSLVSAIAAAAPALSGTLAVRPGTAAAAAVRRPLRRHPSIPMQARDFGTISGMVPTFRSNMLILFNNVTGMVTGVCTFNYNTENDNISQDEIANCTNTNPGQLLSGFVRFVRNFDGPELTAIDVEDPIGPALNMRMVLNLTSSGHRSESFCIDDSNMRTLGDGSLRFTTYFCVIFSNNEGLWSGTTTIQPFFSPPSSDPSFVISDDESGSGTNAASRYRVCRYTPATSESQTVANQQLTNQDHPRNYVNVSGNLTNQNFVVIPSVKHCPTDVPATPATGDLINTNTLQHQPAPSL
jgi:Tfp pilus assembly protein PilV